MAKKIAFLIVMIFVLLIASTTVFAAETDTETSNVGFTKDKATLAAADAEKEVSVSDLENKYGEVFFGEDTESDLEIVSIDYGRDYPHEMRHLFYGQTSDFDLENPYIMLMYIKIDGTYVPLNDVERNSNMTEEVCYLKTAVDLEYIGLNKVNEVRIIVFRKNDCDNLVLNENLQVTNLDITFRRWNLIERIQFGIREIFN
ncbi:MAG TPA: hypothetical protein GXZ22_04910 [Clostridiaceae bacterium]|jgi:hypothetical protein|nr:hypothetical protein [Clostridiaceae bacterium]